MNKTIFQILIFLIGLNVFSQIQEHKGFYKNGKLLYVETVTDSIVNGKIKKFEKKKWKEKWNMEILLQKRKVKRNWKIC